MRTPVTADPWGLAERLDAAQRELADQRALLEKLVARGETAIYIDTATAYKLVGLRSAAALRQRARRSATVAGARIDARRWDRQRLLQALGADAPTKLRAVG